MLAGTRVSGPSSLSTARGLSRRERRSSSIAALAAMLWSQGAKLLAFVESADRPEGAQEGFLNDVLGPFRIAEDPHGQPVERPGVEPHDDGEGVGIPGTGAADGGLFFLGHVASSSSRGTDPCRGR